MSLCENCRHFTPELISPEDDSSSGWAQKEQPGWNRYDLNEHITVHSSWRSFAISLNRDCPICWAIWRCVRPSPTTAIYEEECLGFRVQRTLLSFTPESGTYQAGASVDTPVNSSFRPSRGPAIGKWSFDFTIHKTDEETFIKYEKKRPITSQQTASTVAAVARRWICECESEHSNCTARSLSPNSAKMPTRLLDVGSSSEKVWRITEPQGRVLYTALSHRWTKITPRLLTENKDAYYNWKPDSLLPQSYQDIIALCRILHFQYVWIDSLCILQDDGGDDFRHEAPIMQDIYQHASLTLTICWDSAGATIFRDCRPRSIPRPKPRDPTVENISPTVTIGNYVFVNFWDEFLYGVTTSTINHRAWVLQERYLSRRILYLGNDQLYWECDGRRAYGSYITSEASVPGDSILGPGCRESVFVCPKGLNDNGWSDIIETYTKSALTFESDRFIALSGLAKAISEKTKDTYLAGIWLEYWMKDILWAPRGGRLPNLYQTSPIETKDTTQGNHKISLPSWSWLGFDGCVEAQPWRPHDVDRAEFLTSRLNSFESTRIRPLATLVGSLLTPSGCDPFSFFESAVLKIKGLLVPLDIDSISQNRPLQNNFIRLKVGEGLGGSMLKLEMNRHLNPSLCCFMIPLFLYRDPAVTSSRTSFHSAIARGLVVQESPSGDNRQFIRVGAWGEISATTAELSPILSNTIARTVTITGAESTAEQTASDFEARLMNFATDQISIPVKISHRQQNGNSSIDIQVTDREHDGMVECSSFPYFTNAEWTTISLI